MRIGLIGAGLQGTRRARSLRGIGDAQLVVVTDHYRERAELLAEEVGCEVVSDWNEITARSDVDTVIVCTPPDVHESVCVSALSQGKHVLCEKPLARTPEEALRILEAAQPATNRIKCGFNLRHHPGIAQAKQWLDSGAIGTPLFFRCRYGIGGRPGYEADWRMKPETSGGGQLMDQGMHALDLAGWFLGEFREVCGFGQTAYWDIAPVEDNSFCLLRTATGQVASIHVSWTQWKNLFSLEVFGADGYVLVDGLGGSYGTEKATLGKRTPLLPFREETIEFRGEDHSWIEEWKEFASAIEEGRE
ncbi:MAG: Gfo/Idh/MocA family oxidoreductase, partial [Dehalococcoidia bacterium]